MRKVRYFDVLRVFAFALIIYFHMLMELVEVNYFTLEGVGRAYCSPNLHISMLAVALFFMLSGACLYVSTDKDTFSAKEFYLKRFQRILIPYYIVYLMYLCFKLVTLGGFDGVFTIYIAPWRWVFTLLGLDEYVSMLGFPTFTLGIGEWFLGCLILVYAVFPLIRQLMRRFGSWFMVAATICYIIYVLNYPFVHGIHTDFFAKLYEFLLGMYLARYLKPVKGLPAAVCLALVLAFIFWPVSFPIALGFKITLLAAIIFVGTSFFEPYLQKTDMTAINAIVKYSFEIYLVHHAVIFAMTDYAGAAGLITSPFAIACLTIAELIVIVLLAIFVKKLSTAIISIIK